MNNNKYFIIPVEKITSELLKDCLQDSMDTLRLSTNKKSAVLKFSGDAVPAAIRAEDLTIYNRDQIVTLMTTPEWTTNSLSPVTKTVSVKKTPWLTYLTIGALTASAAATVAMHCIWHLF